MPPSPLCQAQANSLVFLHVGRVGAAFIISTTTCTFRASQSWGHREGCLDQPGHTSRGPGHHGVVAPQSFQGSQKAWTLQGALPHMSSPLFSASGGAFSGTPPVSAKKHQPEPQVFFCRAQVEVTGQAETCWGAERWLRCLMLCTSHCPGAPRMSHVSESFPPQNLCCTRNFRGAWVALSADCEHLPTTPGQQLRILLYPQDLGLRPSSSW